MGNSTDFGFAKLVPGFDFLQNLSKGAAQGFPQMPSLSSWVAPTLNVEELDKRIGELKAVHFWLDQNGKALGATIQALEVQKMTLATLQGMNFSMGELASALQLKTHDADPAPGGTRHAAEAAGAEDSTAPRPADAARAKSGGAKKRAGKAGNAGGAAPVDPLQWWGALTQQFQQIAANAMQDVAQQTAADGARNKADGAGAQAARAATGTAKTAAAKATKPSKAAAPAPAVAPAKKAARKATRRKT